MHFCIYTYRYIIHIRTSVVAQWQRILLPSKRSKIQPCVRKIPWKRKWQPTTVFLPGKNPWTEEPGSLQCMGLQRIGHTRVQCNGLPWGLRWQRICLQCGRPGFDPWVKKIPWRRVCQATPLFLPGEFHGQRNLVGYSPWGCKEPDGIERLTHTTHTYSVVCVCVCVCLYHNLENN